MAPNNKKKGNNKKNRNKNKEGGNNNSSVFPIPPRSNDQIIGRISSHSVASKRTILELENALKYEINSEKHQSVVETLQRIRTNTRIVDNNNMNMNMNTTTTQSLFTLPSTYETKGMLELGSTPLLYGRDTLFMMNIVELPACGNIQTLTDEDMGEADRHQEWTGGECWMIMLKNPIYATESYFHGVYLGKCYLTSKCLWDFAVQFRSGRSSFDWPGYWSALQCPFCANLATPPPPPTTGNMNSNDNDNTKYAMIIQVILQRVRDQTNGKNTAPSMAQRYMPRLCCWECFEKNLKFPLPGSADRDTILDYSIFPFQSNSSSGRNIIHPAYYCMLYFETSGTSSALAKVSAKAIAQVTKECQTNFKTRVSKSSTMSNRGQPVMKFQPISRQTCSNCGLTSKKCKSSCGACSGLIYYCNRQCQKNHWKLHKPNCRGVRGSNSNGDGGNDNNNDVDGSGGDSATPQPSPMLNLQRKLKKKASNDVDVKCPKCNTHSIQEGCPIMCIRCGDFIVCGSCATKDGEFGAVNVRATVLFFFCMECLQHRTQSHDNTKPGVVLCALLDTKHIGPHVKYARLQLAQMRLNDTYNDTGIPHDMEAAKKEYLWLANDCDYAPAQFALASFLDPDDHESLEYWDGPIPFHLLLNEDDTNNVGEIRRTIPFSPNANLAKQYYDRSAGVHRWSMALSTVGVLFKNGSTVCPQNLDVAVSYLTDAANRGDPLAASSIGQMYISGMGVEYDIVMAMKFCRQAADHGLCSAMFMIAQFGVQLPELRTEGRKWALKLINDCWDPPDQHLRNWFAITSFYGFQPRYSTR